ncbi:MAG TPA: UMP kinase, partial [Bacteroidia bacterium]|nr:UMP kinase [Bacteroidia bacterium]
EKDKNAKRYDTISFDEVYKKGLQIMDLTAFTLCKENKLPIIVFDINKKGNLKNLLQNKKIGTLVSN